MRITYAVVLFICLLGVSEVEAQWRPASEPGTFIAPASWTSGPVVAPQLLRRIHVLIAADTSDENIGEGVAVDMQYVRETFVQLVADAGQLRLKTLGGDDLTKEGVMRTIAEFQPGPDDAFVFLFSGHGAHNDDGHYFVMADGEGLYRSDVIKAMRQTGVRLVAALSNGCNVRSDRRVTHSTFRPSMHMPEHVIGSGSIAPLFDELLLKPYGVIDINGASEGETTRASAPRGSTSLRPLCDCFRENRNRRLSWKTVVRELNGKIEAELKKRYPQCAEEDIHTAKVWSLPNTDQGLRLGVAAADNGGHGVLITGVFEGYPGTRIEDASTGQTFALEPYDVILSVNGLEIRNLTDYRNGVKGSPQEMAFTIRDCRTGRAAAMKARLRY